MQLLISGPSGAGKSTFIETLLAKDPRVCFSVSTTTRAPRGNEKRGVDYDYVDDAEFDRLIAENAFVEWADVHEHRYGTRKDRVQEIVDAGQVPLLDLDVQGGKQVIGLYGPDLVSVFVFAPSWEELERRLRARGTDSEDVIQTRLANARWEVGYAKYYDYWVINDELDEARRDMMAIITAERRRRIRLGEPPLA